MAYQKPTIINAAVVNAGVCGSGPCGRPCSNRA